MPKNSRRDGHIIKATDLMFRACNKYYEENQSEITDMKMSDFALSVAARNLTCVLQAGKVVFGIDMTEKVVAGIIEDMKPEHDNVAKH